MDYTENLRLFKYNTTDDKKLSFDIDKCLNDNWDKIDKAYKDGFIKTDNDTSQMVDANGTRSTSNIQYVDDADTLKRKRKIVIIDETKNKEDYENNDTLALVASSPMTLTAEQIRTVAANTTISTSMPCYFCTNDATNATVSLTCKGKTLTVCGTVIPLPDGATINSNRAGKLVKMSGI